jgi:LysR family nitrogen assimilation transcriptional regulator
MPHLALSTMRPPLWRLFIDLAEQGSLSKVSMLRDIAQAQLSRQLSELEAQCGGALFIRHGRGVHLSELGRWALPRVQAWLAHTEQLANDIRSGSGVPIGEVRIGTMPSTVRPLLCPVLARAKVRYPLVRINVREALDSQMDEGLHSAKFDLAIRYLHPQNLKSSDRVLRQVDSFLVGPVGDKVTRQNTVAFAELAHLPLVLPCRPSLWRDNLDSLARAQGFSLQVALEADSLTVQKDMVMQAGMHTLLGPMALQPELQNQQLQAAKIIDPELPRMMALTTRAGMVETLAQQVIAELIVETAQGLKPLG